MDMSWVATIVSVPAIVAAVNIFKRIGIPDGWAPLLAIIFGAGFGVLASYAQMGSFEGIAPAILFGIVTGLSASGVYDVTKKADTVIAVSTDSSMPIGLQTQMGNIGDY